jgi:hypothetical protein
MHRKVWLVPLPALGLLLLAVAGVAPVARLALSGTAGCALLPQRWGAGHTNA